MGEFVAAKRRFVVHLRTEDLHEALARSEPDGHVPVEALADALGQLVEWGNLRADPDTSRVTTVEDFHRARFLYQLTRPGEAAERALTVYDEQLGRRGALQAVALADIATQLRELAVQAQPDPGRVGLLLRDLVARFTDLADNAQAFMGSLQRTIDLYDADVDAFRAYKNHLVDYLERFIKDLVTVGGEISRLLNELEDTEVARLIGIAARRDAEDAAPDSGEHTIDGEDHREAAYLAGLAAWEERWRGLRQGCSLRSSHEVMTVSGPKRPTSSSHSDHTAHTRLCIWSATGCCSPRAPAETRRSRGNRRAFLSRVDRSMRLPRNAAMGPMRTPPDGAAKFVGRFH